MAEIQDPAYLENGSHTAQNDRLVLQSLVAKEGIVGAGALAVTEKSGTPNMSVDVAAGAAFIAGELGAAPGTYHVYNDAVKNLAISAADATNPRKDLVVARVYDSFYSGATNSWALEVVTGTPAASPAEPTVPDNCYVLALVDVAAGATSITNANITDRRKESSSPTGLRAIVKFTSSGTFTKADYPWLRAVRARVQAGGGGAASSPNPGGSPGGGGGEYAETFIEVADLATSETVTVGAGGAGGNGSSGVNTPGSNGGNSSFGAHAVANGGEGTPSTYRGGLGGSGGTGDFTAAGQGGGAGHPGEISGTIMSGQGGASHLGGGGRGQGNTTHGGTAGGLYGGGGGGSGRTGTGGSVSGGNGADGVVIVELYA